MVKDGSCFDWCNNDIENSKIENEEMLKSDPSIWKLHFDCPYCCQWYEEEEDYRGSTYECLDGCNKTFIVR